MVMDNMSSTLSGRDLLHLNDVEVGLSKDNDDLDNHLDLDVDPSDPFDITHTKNVPPETLRRWRQAALVLNVCRRFRYTLDLKKEEEKEQRKRMIRAHAQVIRAALLFKLAGENQIGAPVAPPIDGGDYPIGLERLASMTHDHKLSVLEQYGGVKGLSGLLSTNLEKGLNEDEADFSNRRNAFGSNTYPRKKGRSFWMFLWEAWQDLTLIILIIAAAVSLGLGIKTEGLKEGWYDGGSIFFAILLVILVTASCNYKPYRVVQVTIVVVAVPDGLPLAVTLTLAYLMRKMMADKALANIDLQVRRLSACETMGSATTICSDKTGTLTLNEINPPADSSQLHPSVVSLLSEGVAHNSAGNVFVSKDGGNVEISGSPTEKAILSWATKLGMKFDAIRSESTILHVFLSTQRKSGWLRTTGFFPLDQVFLVDGIITEVRSSDAEVHIHWKGADELVLAACSGYLDSNGCLQSMIRQGKPCEHEFFEAAIDKMAASSLRCVALAYRLCEQEKAPRDEESCSDWVLPEDNLVLLAIVGIKDPCRPGVKDAVKICMDAGVKVRMITGDNIQTAKAIALECGILCSAKDVTEHTIEGRVFRALPGKERTNGQENNAVTGDGTNDAPAFTRSGLWAFKGQKSQKKVQISLYWMIIFNIQKFIQFQLTVNVAALVINVVAAISSGDVPLNSVQELKVMLFIVQFHHRGVLLLRLLWVNLIMDTLGALALATEPPTDNLMHRSPVGRREPLITNIMWRNLLIQGNAYKVKNSLIFNAFVMCQIFNEFNARKPEEINCFKGVTKNYLFMGIIGFTLTLQIIIIEFLGKFTSTVRLDWQLWLVSVGIGIISWPLAIVGKLIPVPKTPVSKFFVKPFRQCRRPRDA
ncbi:Calcium-transporting ATPase 9, plasma membrane-type [Hibiscus syriacus]|uniref:Calcium-transporting ATPase 9, plasma membrane-type n=1 Tax=Hibiscus syriacus TaxID=106335 RepID=A0A6A3BPE0_HIBSY|nr:Calcium-transporting ATPase 9, plasma membrane-type [Hibiscus syriacus]